MLLVEMREVFSRSKLRSVVEPEAAAGFLVGLEEGALVLRDPTVERQVAADPDDDYLLALASEGAAECLVSGDRHLTDLVNVKPPVFTPRQFVDRYLL